MKLLEVKLAKRSRYVILSVYIAVLHLQTVSTVPLQRETAERAIRTVRALTRLEMGEVEFGSELNIKIIPRPSYSETVDVHV